MFHQIFFHILICLCVFGRICTQEVEIPQGTLRGDIRTNRDGGTYYAFKKIPFGKAPVGDLRFKAPVAADGWTGVRDATEEVPICPQLTSNVAEEDCLYLNVYTPGLPNDVTEKAVLVFIYGGAYVLGDATENMYGAQSFLTKDVVVVTFNYRVGVFGFISLDDPNLGITGNAGLKDQVLALQWVNNNIEYFGGDPGNILIFGESAGSVSVHFHLLSPMSQGLFHKAISESGVSLSPIVLDNARNNALMLAEELEIQTENWEDMLTSLQEASAEDLLRAQLALVPDYPQYSFISRPIVEISSSSEPTFLERQPIDIIQSGDYNHVPFINGINDAEGLMLFNNILADTDEAPVIPYFTGYIPLDLQIEPGSEAEEDIIQRYIDFYYNGDESDRENITGDVRFYTDYAFTYPQYRTTMEQLKTALYPIYFYYFTADTQLNTFKLQSSETASYPGAAHADELPYLWYGQRTPEIEEGSVEDLASRNLIELWTNFAIYGNPTPEGSDYVWEPVQEDQFNYLHINTESSYLEVDLLPDNIELWSRIYDDYYEP